MKSIYPSKPKQPVTFLKKSKQTIPTFIVVCNAGGRVNVDDL